VSNPLQLYKTFQSIIKKCREWHKIRREMRFEEENESEKVDFL
jgi:hypothetical protein